MSIIGTFNGWQIVSLPCDTIARVTHPSSIEFDEQEVVATNQMAFTGQEQVYDWMASWWEAQVSFPPMNRWSYDAWSAFISECRGPLNVFLIGDPKAKKPKGSVPVPVSVPAPGRLHGLLNVPMVSGAGQTGYSLSTRGWTPNAENILLFGDFIQVGLRLYKVTDVVNADGSGDATLPVWPPVRDLPADGSAIITRGCRGLFRLKAASGNKHSVNVGLYGLSGFPIREAI